MSLHTLLAATDLSAPSRHTAQRAAILAQQIGAKLELVHVLDKRELDELQRLLGEDGEVLKERIRSQTRELLAQLANDVGEPLGVSAGRHLVEGKVLESIAAQVDALNASLLIVGARGTGFMRDQLLGTTAERLQRIAQCPVLTVKQPPRKTYQSVLVPIDFSPWSLNALRLALAVAPKAELILLHAYEVPFENKMRNAGEKEEAIRSYRDKVRQEADSRLHQTAVEAGIAIDDWHPVVIHGDAVDHIREQGEEQGADLIVLGKHGLGIGVGVAEEFLLGSNTRQILIHARCDVLVAPYRKTSSTTSKPNPA
jgi:nucleotide-binding universal stress UspA family protein